MSAQSKIILKITIGSKKDAKKTVIGAKKRPIVNCRLDAAIYCPRAFFGAYSLTKLYKTGARTISPNVKINVSNNSSQILVVKPTANIPKPANKQLKMKTCLSLHDFNHFVIGKTNKTNNRPFKPNK